MSPVDAGSLLVGALLAWALVPAAARAARRLGLTDPHPAATELPERKRGQVPQPLAGAWPLALAAGLAAALGQVGAPALAFAAAAAAVGWLDDRLPRGLAPGPKLALQALACAPLAAAWAGGGGPFGLVGAGAVLAALLAGTAVLNLVNTWDHADGLAPVLGAVGLAAGGAPLVAGACGGVAARQLWPRDGERPFLGDAGSHLVGALLLAVSPAAWPVLILPAADLLRVLLSRLAARQAPWVGDRRHLGHWLAARGVGPRATALGQLAVLLLLLALL